jgi:N6-adenosine-specific RNA methylase IME4
MKSAFIIPYKGVNNIKIDIFNTENQYDILYTDPPWPQTKGNARKSRPNQGKNFDYQTLEIEDIKTIHKKAVSLCAEKHNVFMWTIDKYLHDAEQMMKELGYELHARFIWDKENGVAPAFTVRFAHEYLLWFYRKGDILMPHKAARGKYTTVIREPSTNHSKKPLFAYKMLEKMFPQNKKLELFARNEHKNWDCWGNEC